MADKTPKIANAMYIQPSPSWMAGQQYAHRSIVLGVFSLFFMGVFLGPAAVRQANKAESLNVVAVFGRTFGRVGTGLGVLALVIYSYKLFAPEPVREWMSGLPTFLGFFLPW